MSLRVLLLCVALSLPAWAYLDPATGSVVVQAVLAALAGVALFFHKVKAGFYRLFGIKKKPEEKPTPPKDESA